MLTKKLFSSLLRPTTLLYRSFTPTLRKFSNLDPEGFPYPKHEFIKATEQTCEIIANCVSDILENNEVSIIPILTVSKYEEDYDCEEHGDGVLNLQFGRHGTFVISRQTPRRQLWLSSPKSGPWHYDYDHKKKDWVPTQGDVPFFER